MEMTKIYWLLVFYPFTKFLLFKTLQERESYIDKESENNIESYRSFEYEIETDYSSIDYSYCS